MGVCGFVLCVLVGMVLVSFRILFFRVFWKLFLGFVLVFVLVLFDLLNW